MTEPLDHISATACAPQSNQDSTRVCHMNRKKIAVKRETPALGRYGNLTTFLIGS